MRGCLRAYTLLSAVTLCILLIAAVPPAYCTTSQARSIYIGVMTPVCFFMYVAAAYFLQHKPTQEVLNVAADVTALRSSVSTMKNMYTNGIYTKELTKLANSLSIVRRENRVMRAYCANVGIRPQTSSVNISNERSSVPPPPLTSQQSSPNYSRRLNATTQGYEGPREMDRIRTNEYKTGDDDDAPEEDEGRQQQAKGDDVSLENKLREWQKVTPARAVIIPQGPRDRPTVPRLTVNVGDGDQEEGEDNNTTGKREDERLLDTDPRTDPASARPADGDAQPPQRRKKKILVRKKKPQQPPNNGDDDPSRQNRPNNNGTGGSGNQGHYIPDEKEPF